MSIKQLSWTNSVTRWTVRANSLKKIIDNYEPLLKLWKETFEEKLDAETKSRIIGCDYNLFYESVEKSAAKSTLPRKRNTPNHSIIQFVEGHKSEELHHPETAHVYFKAIYNEAFDTIINLVQDRFEQSEFKVFGQVEQLFLKSVNKEDHSDEIMTVESTFRGDYDHDSLITELQLLPAIFDNCKPVNFGDIAKGIQLLSREKRKLIRNVGLIARLVVTKGATSATPEQPFSTLRRLKT